MGMTPVERLITAVNCQEPDRVPVQLRFLPGFKYFNQWATISGKKEISEDLDLKSKLEIQLEFFQQWPDVVPEISGPTARVSVGLSSLLDKKGAESGMGVSQHMSREIVTERLKKAKIPDPHTDERMLEALDEWQRYIDHLPPETCREYGGLVWRFGTGGPFGSVASLFSYPEAFCLLYEDPKFLHELLEFHTMSVVPWVEAVEQVFIRAGLTLPRFFSVSEILPMLSPAHAKEFILPYMSRIYGASQSPIKGFHCDNRVGHMPDVITNLGANVYFGNFSDYSVLKKSFGDKMALMGNVPSIDILTRGSTKDVEECCRWLIAKCAPGGGFVLSSGGGLDPAGNTPLENINAMVRAGEKYGEYPLSVSADILAARYQAVMSRHFSRKTEGSRKQEEPHLNDIAEQTCLGNTAKVKEVVKEALEASVTPERIFQEGICQGLTRATDLFYEECYFHPEMERADGAFQAGIRALGASFKPEYFKGTVVIGSAKGSLQESGIRLIQVMLQGAGFHVINLGVGVVPERFIDEAVKVGAQIIAIGVYFYTHTEVVELVTQTLRERGLGIKTLAGGMGISPQVAQEMELDAYASDGLEAQNKALVLIDQIRKEQAA
ncbi:uroporphyrinogen decarboxylase family protein [Chloroflexota bacterium]